jgi:hypothetical protein
MLQLAPWFFGLLAGAIFGIIVDYLDPVHQTLVYLVPWVFLRMLGFGLLNP